MTSSSLTVDPAALLDARRDLLRAELALSAIVVPPPDTGSTTAVTGAVLDRVSATVTTLSEDLLDLAEGLRHLVDDLADQDGQATARFDLLRIGADS